MTASVVPQQHCSERAFVSLGSLVSERTPTNHGRFRMTLALASPPTIGRIPTTSRWSFPFRCKTDETEQAAVIFRVAYASYCPQADKTWNS